MELVPRNFQPNFGSRDLWDNAMACFASIGMNHLVEEETGETMTLYYY
jgi:hypothetical protein